MYRKNNIFKLILAGVMKAQTSDEASDHDNSYILETSWHGNAKSLNLCSWVVQDSMSVTDSLFSTDS